LDVKSRPFFLAEFLSAQHYAQQCDQLSFIRWEARLLAQSVYDVMSVEWRG
jgi:hypothetical protein